MEFDKNILSSSNINFLFGAGVNGKAFPQFSSFNETNVLIEKYSGKKVNNFEEDLNKLPEAKQKIVKNKFISELKKYHDQIDFEHQDIKDIEKLMLAINKLIIESENRILSSKQINIYTLNYDVIVEKTLNKIGVLNNMVSSSNVNTHDKFFNIVGYDYDLKRYIPTFLVSKIHGDLSLPVLPGRDKYDEVLLSNEFELLFKMKSQLSRMNSILFVIGYSGYDEHINRLLKDCVNSGLTIYWFKYSENDYVPPSISSKIIIIEQEDKNNKINMSLMCARMIERLWATKLEE